MCKLDPGFKILILHKYKYKMLMKICKHSKGLKQKKEI